ncbi:hypothetical protein [Streptomyces sp. cg35]|uniref:hypothetical protein n=1 Tax=Streptomyces sp. cg35 TaxID=3421650 RepID=UPI003D17A218
MTLIRPVEVSDDPQVTALVELLRARCHSDTTGLIIDDPHVIATLVVEAQRARRARAEAANKWINPEGRRILNRCYAGHVPAAIVTGALIAKARRDKRLHLLKEEP